MPTNQPMTAARCAAIRATCDRLGIGEDALALAIMLNRAMRQLELAYNGATRTKEMVDLLKEWGSI